MGNIKNQGHYECPSCSGTEYYSSEETTGAYAVTLNNPGPVDTTSIHTLSKTVERCSKCDSEMKWIPSAAALKARARSHQAFWAFAGLFFGTLLPLTWGGITVYFVMSLGSSLGSALFGSLESWLMSGLLLLMTLLVLFISLGLFNYGLSNMKKHKAAKKRQGSN
jgi:hypothetical protein